MKCPFCGAVDDRVVDSRESREGEVIRRRRECVSCGRRFTSYETIEEIPYMVVKKDGRREPSTERSCAPDSSRPARSGRSRRRSSTRSWTRSKRGCTTPRSARWRTSQIGALVMERLRELDKVAYVRFASVYRKFEDVDEFLHELKNLIGRAETKAT